jgi:flavin reductase (DIM6/NTAB) family NADH-FMN oxidoreductase RutF
VDREPTSRQFRDTVGMFTTGITVVTAVSARLGHGMTANAFTSVSLDPLLVLVCVQRSAVMHKVVDAAGAFAVSVLSAGQERLARWFSDSSRPEGIAQFDGIDWRPGAFTGAPVLGGTLARLECRVERAYEGGDHDIFLARVIALDRAGDTGDGPLVWFGGSYRQLGEAASDGQADGFDLVQERER